MLKSFTASTSNPRLLIPRAAPFSGASSIHVSAAHFSPSGGALKFNCRRASGPRRRARRRIRDDGGKEEEESEYNEEIALLEAYTQAVKDEVLIVRAAVDDEEVEVVVFKGFSSCLSYETSSDPSRSVIPARAVIGSVDRVKGPFDPSNVEYIERGLSFHQIKTRLQNQISK
ncbi:uncharacterized protein LOC127263739 [Andrographis paniculata]|uniref:uncharacterized protein LOC127263739 n=1 Tax=Andrographis paniculata TaxID=175694 RepID=UPI0021E79EA0|nr:uncharacterized protein LOC127263739 [Andrographis paniculata]